MPVTIGISIPNVPHEVPVENASRDAVMNITTGRRLENAAAVSPTVMRMKFSALRSEVMFLSEAARVRINIGEIIAEKPCGIHSIAVLKLTVLRIGRYIREHISVRIAPPGRADEVSVSLSDRVKVFPSRIPPEYRIQCAEYDQQHYRHQHV